jgi:hypothetical protein
VRAEHDRDRLKKFRAGVRRVPAARQRATHTSFEGAEHNH